MDSVKTPFPKCVRLLLENIKLDPYFKEFYQWSRENGVPVIVLSSGMTEIIRALLVHLVGPEANDIEIVCNESIDRAPKKKDEEGGWEIHFHDDSDFGHGCFLFCLIISHLESVHRRYTLNSIESKLTSKYVDKSLTIRPYAKHFAERPNEPRPTLFYAGDGVSDLSAARETDLLFAKKGHGRDWAL